MAVALKSKPRASRRVALHVASSQPIAKLSVPLASFPKIVRGAGEDDASFHVFFSDSLIPLYIFDLETLQCLEVNRAAVAQYGYTREEFLQLYATELQPHEEIPRFVTFLHEQVPQLLANGGVNRWNGCGYWKQRCKNSSIVNVYLSIHAVTFAGRHALAASAFDVTETLRTDATLRYSVEMAYQLTDNLDAVFWVMTPDLSKILYVSKAYEKVWGRSCASLYVNSWSFLDGVHPEDRERTRRMRSTPWTADCGSYEQEYRIIRPTGETFWIRERVFSVKSETGEVVRVVGIAEDISLRKQAQEALENVSRRLIEAQEAERRYFASELHDEIGQTLSILKINVETVLSESPPHLRGRLVESVSLIEETLDQVRNLCLDLRPSQLDDLGLVSTVAWYVDRQARRTGLSMHLNTFPLPRLEQTIETTCFRIVQEALTNVVRHASAQDVWIELRHQQGQLRLTISDNGVGFDKNEIRTRARQGRSSGIVGMEERVRLAGGTFELTTQPNQGVRICVGFPCPIGSHVADLARSSMVLGHEVRTKPGKTQRKTIKRRAGSWQ